MIPCRHLGIPALLLAASAAFAQPAAPELPSGLTAKQAVSARRDMIATANPLATEAGYQILRKGGSAANAAVAAQLVLNLVEPQSSGIGGGAFIVHHQGSTGKLAAYDGRETAPAAATPERFLDRDGAPLKFIDAVVGGKSVGVPGTLRVLELVHRKHGKLRWAALFAPAIELAERGFPVSARLHGALAAERVLARDPVARTYFYQADGKPHPVGHLLKNPVFAATLKRIATAGPDAFYRGDIARDIVAKIRAHLTNKDSQFNGPMPGIPDCSALVNGGLRLPAPNNSAFCRSPARNGRTWSSPDQRSSVRCRGRPSVPSARQQWLLTK